MVSDMDLLERERSSLTKEGSPEKPYIRRESIKNNTIDNYVNQSNYLYVHHKTQTT